MKAQQDNSFDSLFSRVIYMLGAIISVEGNTMFGLSKSPPFTDPQLGKLMRSRNFWRGTITVALGSSIPLAITGTRSEPDPQALLAVRDITTQYSSWVPTIESALFEHYLPYAQALAAGELHPPREEFPKLDVPSQVWPHVSLAFVSVTPLDGLLTLELGYTTAWDKEHTLGARFQAGKFIELCGSVLRP